MDIDDLPNLVLEIVFSNLNQYGDLENVRLVCRRWYYVASTIIAILKKSFLRCNQLQWLVILELIPLRLLTTVVIEAFLYF